MANPSNAHGFSPVNSILGSSIQQPHMYVIPQADTTAYAVGDVVKSLAGSDAVGVPYAIIASNTDPIRGVIVGIVVSPTVGGASVGTPNLNIQKIPATKANDYYILVNDDPNQVFEVMGNNTGTLATTAIGKNCNMAYASPGAYLSATVLGVGATGGSAATTSTVIWKILGLAQRVNVDFTANAPLLVKPNVHELGSAGTSGV